MRLYMKMTKTKIRAYTLIELILVIAISTILLSISFYGIKNLTFFKEKSEIEIITRDINYTKTISIRLKKKSSLVFNDDGYKIYVGNEEKSNYNFEVLSIVTKPYMDRFEFTKRGATSEKGSGTLVLKGKKKLYEITVAPVTGNINMKVK